MPTDRPCDQQIVPDNCADTGGLVSVQVDITVTEGRSSTVWRKNAVVFISRRDEFILEQEFIQKQSYQISKDVRACLTGQVQAVLFTSSSASAVNLTTVADCVSGGIAKPRWLGEPPRGIFISPQDKLQLTSISADLAACEGRPASRSCVDAPGQSFARAMS